MTLSSYLCNGWQSIAPVVMVDVKYIWNNVIEVALLGISIINNVVDFFGFPLLAQPHNGSGNIISFCYMIYGMIS